MYGYSHSRLTKVTILIKICNNSNYFSITHQNIKGIVMRIIINVVQIPWEKI